MNNLASEIEAESTAPRVRQGWRVSALHKTGTMESQMYAAPAVDACLADVGPDDLAVRYRRSA